MADDIVAIADNPNRDEVRCLKAEKSLQTASAMLANPLQCERSLLVFAVDPWFT
jgi:hypothetical protein